MKRLALLIAVALSACASDPRLSDVEQLAATLNDPRLGERQTSVCFTRGFNGFRDETDDTVVVTRGVDEDYLLVMRYCPQLDRARAIGFPDGIGSTCLRENDRLLVSESVFSARGPGQIGPITCQVDAIYTWDESALVEPDPDSEPTDD